jgi:hypothetical protein
LFIWSGTGRAQIATITSNTATALTFPTLSTAPDATSRYNIAGYDGGTLTSTSGRTVTDTAKTWTVDRWKNYAIRIIAGTGDGQVRQIISNGTNSLVVNDVWTVQPDNTSRYVIQSGAVWMSSGATVANGGFELAYYSVLEDIWYAKSVQSNMIPVVLTENCLERITENSTIWYTGQASAGTTTTLTDSTASWRVNQWAGYSLFIWTGTGRAQIATITSNTATALTFPTLSTAPDATSRYNIAGYDGGTLTSTSGRTVTDTAKTWTVNRWKNYAIRIIAGTGDGQTRQIISNGVDSLVVNDVWTVQPDNTSIYLITGYSNDMHLSLGANAQLFTYHADESDMVSHARVLEEGTAMVACAMLTDGTSTATHRIFDQKPVPISALAGTVTITATTPQPHQFKAGQWVSIRGVTSAANDVFNVTGKVQIASVPSTTTFTYTPFAAGSGGYQYSDNVALGTSALIDASKFHADSATGGSTTSVTFSRAQPSNINGWYVYGTNVGAGAQVVSGAGTTTLTLSTTGAGTPSGTIRITKWPQPVVISTGGGGGAGVFTCTIAKVGW